MENIYEVMTLDEEMDIKPDINDISAKIEQESFLNTNDAFQEIQNRLQNIEERLDTMADNFERKLDLMYSKYESKIEKLLGKLETVHRALIVRLANPLSHQSSKVINTIPLAESKIAVPNSTATLNVPEIQPKKVMVPAKVLTIKKEPLPLVPVENSPRKIVSKVTVKRVNSQISPKPIAKIKRLNPVPIRPKNIPRNLDPDEILRSRPFIKTMNDMIFFEINLQDFQYYRPNVIQNIMKIGGNSMNSEIHNIFKILLSNQVQANYSFRGLKGKKNFSSTATWDLIWECILARHSMATMEHVKNTVSHILKNAPQRLKNENETAIICNK